jgi:hypothetical protein
MIVFCWNSRSFPAKQLLVPCNHLTVKRLFLKPAYPVQPAACRGKVRIERGICAESCRTIKIGTKTFPLFPLRAVLDMLGRQSMSYDTALSAASSHLISCHFSTR